MSECRAVMLPRRAALLGAAAMAALAAGCGLLPAGPRLIEIPQERLFAQLSGQFPFNRRMLELFDVTVKAPRFRLLPQENRIATELDVTAGQALLRQAFNGRLGLTYGLRYEPEDASVRLADVRVVRFELDGVPDAMQTRMGRIGALLAEEVLSGFVVHRFKPEELRIAQGLGLRPGGINVTGRGLALTLEPADKR
jgi:hypothetical protein